VVWLVIGVAVFGYARQYRNGGADERDGSGAGGES